VRIFTIGLTKTSAERFFETITASGAKRLVDVRLNNVSQLSGFAKRDDLAYFLRRISGIEYVHLRLLSPTQDILDAYKREGEWERYAAEFVELMTSRRIETAIAPEMITDSCLLCSERKPDRCHRRLVAEYFQQHWPNVDITHLEP